MKVSTLWSQIRYIYDKYDFSSKQLVNNVLIISEDNYYLCYFKWNGGDFSLKLEVNYNFKEMTNQYKATIEIKDYPNDKKYGEFFDIIPDEYTKILKPYLRDFQLNTILE